jgi:subtilisin family serine protease
MPTSLLIVEGESREQLAYPVIEAPLAAAMADSSPSDILPIVLHFPEGSTSEMMEAAINRLEMASMSVRHVFSLIPVVSAYVAVSDLETLSKLSSLSGISLDVKRSIVEVPKTDYETLSNGNLTYEHYTEILDAKAMWENGYFGNGTVIAVLDTGAQADHPDLQGRIIDFQDYVGSASVSYDNNGHGTACATSIVGTGAASDGNFTGVAPGAELIVVKVLDEHGQGDDSDIAAGIEYAVNNGADVISLSLGGPWDESMFLVDPTIQACREAIDSGVAVVVASGNSGPAPFSVYSPGFVDEVITVGASAGSTGVAAFSSRGPVLRAITDPHGLFAKPDLVAPGLSVVSGRFHGARTIDFPKYEESTYGSNYTLWSGTSASTAQMAGIIALLKQEHTSLTPLQAKTALMASARDLHADSMEQGWGLVNVSAASALLNASSGQLTLMTPRRYPTLPGSSTVLVIGEDRPSQNITIMSTRSYPSAVLVPSGNASQFVKAHEGPITIGVGYTFVSIGLEVPGNLPLSAIGYYVGSLTLVSGGQNVTDIEIELTVTTYGGRLLVDMAHHDTDLDDPSFYRYFQEYLRQQGVLLEEFGVSTVWGPERIDTDDLAIAETFMIMDTELSYGQTEIDALHQFVEDGGTLLVLSEFYNNTNNQAAFAIDSYNEILAPYGIQCEEFGIGEGATTVTGEFYGVDYGGAVESDPLMDGVENLYVLWGSTLRIDPDATDARGLFWYDQAKTRAIVAVAEAGEGQVIVISDGSTLYDDTLFDAIRGDADNLRMLRNIAGAIIPDTPRIYDVQLNTVAVGEAANLTTYVFDDDLDNVTITVVGPAGSNVLGTPSETLGYVFSTEFILESSGFYDVTIVARDSSGNVKLFHKTFLVPTDPADDVFITALTFGLLAVVGVSLVYVGAIRMGSGRKKPRRVEYPPDEFDSPPEDYGPPPAIE